MHYYNEGKIENRIIDYPIAVGHEGSAKVVEVGKGVRQKLELVILWQSSLRYHVMNVLNV